MKLEGQELKELYEALVKPFGHPDPLGFMSRALLTSEGDPDYIDVEGKRGFQPVLPELALELTGVQEVQSLESNVIATLTIDRIFFDRYKSIDNMIIAFQFGEDVLNDTLTNEHEQFLKDINDSREDTLELMYPPLATVEDVIRLLDPSKIDIRLSNDRIDFFNLLLKGV